MRRLGALFAGAWLALVASLAVGDLGVGWPFMTGAGGSVTLPASGNAAYPTFMVNAPSASNAGGLTVWDNTYSLFTPSFSGTGAALALGFNSGANEARIVSLSPNVAFRNIGVYGQTTTIYAANNAGLAIAPAGLSVSSALAAAGTTFTLGAGTGACATSSTLTGGAFSGSFLCTGTAGASTQIVTLPTSPNGHGWACWASDDTSKVAWAAGANSTTAVTLSGTIATTSDKVVFGCLGY
jgi:hypothetical protein